MKVRDLVGCERSRGWRGLAVLTAVLIDAFVGDPPSRFHPVAWMGSWIGMLRKRAPRQGALASFVYGAATVCGSASLLGLLGMWSS